MPYTLPEILAFVVFLSALWFALYKIVYGFQHRHDPPPPPPKFVEGEVIYHPDDEVKKE